jgi:hypothetical protein
MVIKFFIPLLSVKIKAVKKKNVPTDIQKNANLMKTADLEQVATTAMLRSH